jgi:hypothetical protein
VGAVAEGFVLRGAATTKRVALAGSTLRPLRAHELHRPGDRVGTVFRDRDRRFKRYCRRRGAIDGVAQRAGRTVVDGCDDGSGFGAVRIDPGLGTVLEDPGQPIGTVPRVRADRPVVEDGDAFSLEIAENRHTGVKLVDLLMVSRDQLKIQRFAADQYPAHEFTIDDVHMEMSKGTFLMNGNLIHSGGGISGSILGFERPERGRVLLSFRPRVGYAFLKVGVILVNKMIFTIDGDHFEWVSTKPVLSAGGKWDLWALHEPDYPVPASGWSFFATGLEKRSANP